MNRKVEVFKYEWVDPKTCKAKHMVPDGVAIFHQFGQDYEEFESGGCMFPIAIIERDNGKVEIVHASHIKFTEEVKREIKQKYHEDDEDDEDDEICSACLCRGCNGQCMENL